MTVAPRSPRPGDRLEALLHPAPLLMLLLLVLNDHVLKVHAPGWLSGKLSDVAGLALLPFVLLALADLAAMASPRILPPGRRVAFGIALLTIAAFTVIQATDLGADAFRWGLGAAQWPFRALGPLALGEPIPPLSPVLLTPDLSDLVALPAACVAWLQIEGLPRVRPGPRLPE